MQYENGIVAPTKLALVGIVVGVLSGFFIAQFDPGPSMAAVADKPPFDLGKALDTHLARFNGDYYAIGIKPGVTLEGTSVVVEKIGYGRTSFVTITTTPTGVYSSDGLASPNIRYPGVYSQRMQLVPDPFVGGVLGWSKLTGWTKIPLLDAHSIGFLDTATLPSSLHGVCVTDNATGACG